MPSAVLEAVEVGTTGAGFKTGAGGATEAWASFAACCSRAILALSASAELMPGAATGAGVTPVTVGAGGVGTTAVGVTGVTVAAGWAAGGAGVGFETAGGAAGAGGMLSLASSGANLYRFFSGSISDSGTNFNIICPSYTQLLYRFGL